MRRRPRRHPVGQRQSAQGALESDGQRYQIYTRGAGRKAADYREV
ncbi:hypothetical protein ACRAWD_21340 [Caulobacter segnis]